MGRGEGGGEVGGGGGEVGRGGGGGGKRIRGDAVFSFVGADKAHKGNCGLEGREGRCKQRNKVASILRWQAHKLMDAKVLSIGDLWNRRRQ